MARSADEPAIADQDRGGWHNYCQHCHGRYWVRIADVDKPKARRFVGKESNELHVCEGVPA